MTILQIYNSLTDFYEYNLKDKSVVKVGRDDNNNLIIQNNYISRNHCSFILLLKENEIDDNFYWVIKDNNSSNGTWVNNKKIVVYTLRNKDIITFSKDLEFPNIVYKYELKEKIETKETGAHRYDKEE